MLERQLCCKNSFDETHDFSYATNRPGARLGRHVQRRRFRLVHVTTWSLLPGTLFT